MSYPALAKKVLEMVEFKIKLDGWILIAARQFGHWVWCFYVHNFFHRGDYTCWL
jgi:hypothetical protein